MQVGVFAFAASVAVLSVLAPAVAQDQGGSGSGLRLAQAEGPMVITPRPYSDQPGSYPQNSYPQDSYPPDSYPQGSYPQGSYPPPQSGYDAGGPGTAYEPAPQQRAYAPKSGDFGSPTSGRGSTFSPDEIKDAGHRFFGRVSMGFARVVEYAFQRAGRPNGYILGEEAGGAFVAGLRYGEGILHTKDAGTHKVFWQGPSVGYDFGAEGSKTMVLVYDLQSPGEIFTTYPGIDGSAYFIGGVGITFLARDHVTLAPIRSGIGLRLGANIGYLKYTREPTWNPF